MRAYLYLASSRYKPDHFHPATDNGRLSTDKCAFFCYTKSRTGEDCPMRTLGILAAALLAPFLAAAPAQAQIPTSTGRSFTLSNSAWKVFIPNSYVPRS